jgi:hypothetical protein
MEGKKQDKRKEKIKYQETKCGRKARERIWESEAERKEEARKIKYIGNKK